MNRIYTSTANFRAPYNNVEFAGIGADAPPSWPAGRSYHSTANFMATQDDGYFQNNSLFGLGADRPRLKSADPRDVELYNAKKQAERAKAALQAQTAAAVTAATQITAQQKSNSVLLPVVAILALATAGGVYWYVRRGK